MTPRPPTARKCCSCRARAGCGRWPAAGTGVPAPLSGTASRQTRMQRPGHASSSLPGLRYFRATREVCPRQPGAASCRPWELVASGAATLSRSWREGFRAETAVWEALPDPQDSRGGSMNPDSDSAEPRTSTGKPWSCCPWKPRLRVLETQTQVTWKSLETWLTTVLPPQAHAARWQCLAPRFGGGRGGGSRGHSPRTHGWLAAARTCFSQSLLPARGWVCSLEGVWGLGASVPGAQNSFRTWQDTPAGI